MLRGLNIELEQYLVAEKILIYVWAAKNSHQQKKERFEVVKLQSQQTAEPLILLSESPHQQLGVRVLWENISQLRAQRENE